MVIIDAPLELCAYFPPCRITVDLPKIQGYNPNPLTFGARLRNKRLELGLNLAAFGKLLEVTDETIIYWENERGKPRIYNYPKLIEVLGFLPFDIDTSTLGGRIKAYRYTKGLNREKFSKILGVDKTTLRNWEHNKHILVSYTMQILQTIFKENDMKIHN